MILNKWAIALLQVLFLALTALTAMRVDGVTTVEVWQFVALVVGAGFTVALKLLAGGWHAALKVVAALVGAFFAAAIPLLANAWTIDSTIVVILAIVNAALIQFGVDARIDSAKSVLLDPTKSNNVIVGVDPVAAKIAAASITADPAAHIERGPQEAVIGVTEGSSIAPDAFDGHGQ